MQLRLSGLLYWEQAGARREAANAQQGGQMLQVPVMTGLGHRGRPFLGFALLWGAPLRQKPRVAAEPVGGRDTGNGLRLWPSFNLVIFLFLPAPHYRIPPPHTHILHRIETLRGCPLFEA